MTLQTWLLFCATEAILSLIPGPAVLFVLACALRGGLPRGIQASGGILASNALYFALSATGIAAVLVASHTLFTIIKWAGAAYLVWLGARMLFSRPAPVHDTTPAGAPDPRVFWRAFLVQASNPKALLFFIALYPQFISANAPIVQQVLILGVSSIVLEFVILAGYSALAAQARNVAGTRFAGSLERIGGGVLIAAGARLAWIRS
jgi:threonine/homoserine/homoserine lactone efflux protein